MHVSIICAERIGRTIQSRLQAQLENTESTCDLRRKECGQSCCDGSYDISGYIPLSVVVWSRVSVAVADVRVRLLLLVSVCVCACACVCVPMRVCECECVYVLSRVVF